MMLPVSSYEELLARVRSLTSETIQLRHEIATSLQTCPTTGSSELFTHIDHSHVKNQSVLLPNSYFSDNMNPINDLDLGATGGSTDRAGLPSDKKRNEIDDEYKEIDEKLISSDIPVENNSIHQNGWSPDILGLWHSGPSSFNNSGHTSNNFAPLQDLTLSVTSNSLGPQSMHSFSSSSKRIYSHQQLGAKVEMVYSLLSMLDTDNREDMSKTFLAMSSSAESCQAMRQSGCLPLLIQLIHSYELNEEVRRRSAETLHNVVYAQTDEKRRRREIRVLKLLEQLREYCDELKNSCAQEVSVLQAESEKHPISAIGTLMKFSFDAEHREAICVLGGLHAVTQLLQLDHEAHGSTNDDPNCITLRRYAGMSLTNLTFGDGKNKALLCSFNKFMRALVDQLKSSSEDLRQVTASVLRNLSWRADSESKQALRSVGAVTALTVSALEGKKESTLKSILSALWNLSAHCSLNKIDICSVPGALAFLVKMLRYKSSSNTLSIVENAGGILRNISSHIAVREDYRQILRDNNCFEILLEQLKSPSLTVVSNACGTLWNLSARCPEDQKRLWEMGATTMLRSLVQSKHKMISMGSSAALKNLLTANPDENLLTHLDSTAKSLGLQNLPTLFVRKKKALEQELNITLAETCDNIDPTGSPIHCDPSLGKIPSKCSENRDSVQSSCTDSVCERINQITPKSEEKVLEDKNPTRHDSADEKSVPRKVDDRKLVRRYKCSMIPTPMFKKINQDRINEKTKEAAVEERVNEIGDDIDAEAKDLKKKNKKGTTVLNSRRNSKTSQSYEMSDENILSHSNEIIVDEKFYQTANSLIQEEFSGSEKLEKLHSSLPPSIESKELKNERFQENLMNLEDDISQGFPSTVLIDENVSTNSTELSENICLNCPDKNADEFHENANEKQIIEEGISSRNSLQSLNDTFHITRSDSIDKHSKISGSNGVKVICAEKGLSGLSTETETRKDKIFSSKSNFSDLEILCPGDRFENKNPSHSSPKPNLTTALNVSPRCSVGASKLHDGDCQNEETVNGVKVNAGGEELKTPGDNIFPKFKLGSPITDSSVLQIEAKKICCEINKQQDLDMGCSLTSEVSLVSCSSFLDTGDYSLFDSSIDGIDFDDSECSFLGKTSFKVRKFPFQKFSVSQTVDSLSLPSLGSLKNEQLDALDLDNSILSVASITSEVAETNSKDFEAFNTFTKVHEKIDAENDCVEETSADATLVSNGEDTLNADFFDEDNSLHSQENLPLDPENLKFDKTSHLISKKLTPKEKRKTFQDRYRTYTIRNFQSTELSEKNLVADCQGSNTKVAVDSTRQRNQLESNYGSLNERDFDHKMGTEEEKRKIQIEKFDLPLLTLTKGTKYEKLYFSKSLDKELYVAPDFVFDSRSLTDLLSIGPAERKELVDNAKLVAFSLKTAIQEGEIISDSEGDDDYRSVEIDTATYSKSNRDHCFGKFSLQGLRNEEQYENNTKEDPEKKGARILKQTDEASYHSKSIRGKRKSLYSSPRRNSSRVMECAPDSSKMSKTPLVAKKPLADAISSPTLYRESTFTKENISGSKKVETKTATLLQNNAESKDLNFSRSLNINKPTSSTENLKRTGENQVSKIKRPLSSYGVSKYSEKRVESNFNQKRPFSAGNRIGGDKVATSIKPVPSGLASPKMRISSGNQNIKTGKSFGSGSLVKCKNLSLQSSKSQSDASLNFAASKEKDTSGVERTPKKEVTSKIASLWRKVEETKQKKQNLKDNRVWISPESLNTQDKVLIVEKEDIVDIPSRKIVHSFTCQALADETSSHFCSRDT